MNAEYMKPLRLEVRALLPDNNIDQAKAPEIHDCIATLRKELKDYTQKHPDFNALDVRRRYYELIPELAPLFIYRNSPFYYEAGINGGWYVNKPGSSAAASSRMKSITSRRSRTSSNMASSTSMTRRWRNFQIARRRTNAPSWKQPRPVWKPSTSYN